jgi:hypothetical protein
MAVLGEIRRGLAANLERILGVQVSPYMLANPTPPAAQIVPGEVEYDQAMSRGLDRLTLSVQVFVALGSDIGAQQQLDEFLDGSGAKSVKQAVESDRTLGGSVATARVTRSTAYRVVLRDGGGPVLMAEWEVEVLARGV